MRDVRIAISGSRRGCGAGTSPSAPRRSLRGTHGPSQGPRRPEEGSKGRNFVAAMLPNKRQIRFTKTASRGDGGADPVRTAQAFRSGFLFSDRSFAFDRKRERPRHGGVWHGLIFVSVKRDIGCPWWGRTDVEK
jgi:hypothetical protein